MSGLKIRRRREQAQHLLEDLGNGIRLDMVLIPGGTFLMGSPADEPERFDSEGPQHEVTVPAFLMSRYPVTQAQWRVVANWSGFERKLDPDPSYFKGENRPVERVSWYDAVALCDRLAQRLGRNYRLPSEAEWEYACRAGTKTPFHFGESATTDLANYNGNYSYGRGPKGKYREETTEVGTFSANAFGLSDMHGNVWEWCADDWHRNYEGAPNDGSAWIDGKINIKAEDDEIINSKVLCGGSWNYHPGHCRSACRNHDRPGYRYHGDGFRLACSLPRILL